MFERVVTRDTDVDDQILNSRVIAKSATLGQIRMEIVPSSDGAIFDVLFTGESVATGTAINPWIRVPNITRTTLSARTRIYYDGTSYKATPARATAKSKVQVLGMNPSPQGRFRQFTPERTIERFGWRQTNRTLAEREEIGARKAVERLERFLNDEIAEELALAEFPKRLTTALEKVGLSGKNVRVASTKDAIHVAIHIPDGDAQDNPETTAQDFLGPFPELGDDSDIIVSLHQSAVDRLGYRLLAGAIVNQTGLTRDGQHLAASNNLPLHMSLTLDKLRPIFVRFAGGELELNVKSDQLDFAKTTMPGFGLQMRCRLEPVEGGLRTKLVCSPEITSEGPLQWPSTVKRMVETMLAKQITGRTLKTSFQIKKLGEPSLQPISLRSHEGWLTLGWSRSSPAAPLTVLPAKLPAMPAAPPAEELVVDKGTP